LGVFISFQLDWFKESHTLPIPLRRITTDSRKAIPSPFNRRRYWNSNLKRQICPPPSNFLVPCTDTTRVIPVLCSVLMHINNNQQRIMTRRVSKISSSNCATCTSIQSDNHHACPCNLRHFLTYCTLSTSSPYIGITKPT
jgi:hypothetical protein